MRDRLIALTRGREVTSAVVAAAVVGIILTLAPGLDRLALLLASIALIAGCGALGLWVWKDHREIEWTVSAGNPGRPRGTDRRVTALTRTIEASMAGDRSGRESLHAALSSLAQARLRQHGLDLDRTTAEVSGVLGPELTAYLKAVPPPPLTASAIDRALTALEEH